MKGSLKRGILQTADRLASDLKGKSRLTGFVTPLYDGLSVANIPHTILSLFDLNRKARPTLPAGLTEDVMGEAKKVVLLVIDGLGYHVFRQFVAKNPELPLTKLAGSGRLFPLTSTFPSTTTTALTTLNTGLTPQEHGIIGYTMYLREMGLVANMIRFSPAIEERRDVLINRGLSLSSLLGARTVYQVLSEGGVKAHVLTRNIYKNSGLSRMLHNGATINTYINSPDLFITLRRLLKADGGEPKYIFVYWDLVDVLSHIHGPSTEEVHAELRCLLHSLYTEFLAKVDRSAARDTALLITGDHGLTETPEEHAISVPNYPKLLENLQIPPTGDARAGFLHVKTGEIAAVTRYLNRKFRGKLRVISAAKALKDGFFGFGRVDPEFHYRIGDLIALPTGEHSILYPYRQREGHLKGSHGGLSDREVMVPFICSRLRP